MLSADAERTEGARAALAGVELARSLRVRMPVLQGMAAVLAGKAEPREVADDDRRHGRRRGVAAAVAARRGSAAAAAAAAAEAAVAVMAAAVLALAACGARPAAPPIVDPPDGVSLALYAGADRGYAVVDDRRTVEVAGGRLLLDRIAPGAALPELLIEPLGAARGALTIDACARERLRFETAGAAAGSAGAAGAAGAAGSASAAGAAGATAPAGESGARHRSSRAPRWVRRGATACASTT